MACSCMNSKLFPHRKAQCMWKSLSKMTSDASNSLQNAVSSSNESLGKKMKTITVDENEREFDPTELRYMPEQRVASNRNMLDSKKNQNVGDETWIDSGSIDDKSDDNSSANTEVLSDYVLVDKVDDVPNSVFSLDKVSSMSEFEQELIQKAKRNKLIMKARTSLNTTSSTNAPPSSAVAHDHNV